MFLLRGAALVAPRLWGDSLGRGQTSIFGFLLLIEICAGCGGAGSTFQQPPPPPAADFSMGISSGTVTVPQGSVSAPVVFSITAKNGFSGQVQIALAGLPAGVVSNPPSLFMAAPVSVSARTHYFADSDGRRRKCRCINHRSVGLHDCNEIVPIPGIRAVLLETWFFPFHPIRQQAPARVSDQHRSRRRLRSTTRNFCRAHPASGRSASKRRLAWLVTDTGWLAAGDRGFRRAKRLSP